MQRCFRPSQASFRRARQHHAGYQVDPCVLTGAQPHDRARRGPRCRSDRERECPGPPGAAWDVGMLHVSITWGKCTCAQSKHVAHGVGTWEGLAMETEQEIRTSMFSFPSLPVPRFSSCLASSQFFHPSKPFEFEDVLSKLAQARVRCAATEALGKLAGRGDRPRGPVPAGWVGWGVGVQLKFPLKMLWGSQYGSWEVPKRKVRPPLDKRPEP